jgi:hypothetical protein
MELGIRYALGAPTVGSRFAREMPASRYAGGASRVRGRASATMSSCLSRCSYIVPTDLKVSKGHVDDQRMLVSTHDRKRMVPLWIEWLDG